MEDPSIAAVRLDLGTSCSSVFRVMPLECDCENVVDGVMLIVYAMLLRTRTSIHRYNDRPRTRNNLCMEVLRSCAETFSLEVAELVQLHDFAENKQ
jgi:hypothetical protein